VLEREQPRAGDRALDRLSSPSSRRSGPLEGAWERGVQVMIEGAGHFRINQLEHTLRRRQEVCLRRGNMLCSSLGRETRPYSVGELCPHFPDSPGGPDGSGPPGPLVPRRTNGKSPPSSSCPTYINAKRAERLAHYRYPDGILMISHFQHLERHDGRVSASNPSRVCERPGASHRSTPDQRHRPASTAAPPITHLRDGLGGCVWCKAA
jgi:hypothetical protein